MTVMLCSGALQPPLDRVLIAKVELEPNAPAELPWVQEESLLVKTIRSSFFQDDTLSPLRTTDQLPTGPIF